MSTETTAATGLDIAIRDEGSLFLIEPITDSAKDWLEYAMPSDTMTWSGSYVVEHRYVLYIIQDLIEQGFIVGDA